MLPPISPPGLPLSAAFFLTASTRQCGAGTPGPWGWGVFACCWACQPFAASIMDDSASVATFAFTDAETGVAVQA
eukprot:13111648-Alexandrium_andersonii.AAC.1